MVIRSQRCPKVHHRSPGSSSRTGNAEEGDSKKKRDGPRKAGAFTNAPAYHVVLSRSQRVQRHAHSISRGSPPSPLCKLTRAVAAAAMAMLQDTPSRILRRIHFAEAHEQDLPSLPSLPPDSQNDIEPSTIPDAREESITSFHSQQVGMETHITSTPLAASGSRNTNLGVGASAVSQHTAGTRTRFLNSAHSSLAPSRSRSKQEFTFEASPIQRLDEEGDEESDVGEAGGRQAGLVSERANPADTQSERPLPDENVAREESDEDEEGTELHEAHEDYVSDANSQQRGKYEEYQVSLRSEPKPSPKDPMRNISMRRRHSPAAPRLSHTDSPSTSSSSPYISKGKRPAVPVVRLSPSLSPPTNLSARSTLRDTSHMARAFAAKSLVSTPMPPKPADHTTPPSLPQLPASDLSADSTLSKKPRLHTPSHPGARRRSYLITALQSTTRPRPRTTPHPHGSRRTSLPMSHLGLNHASAMSEASSTPSSTNDLTTHRRANASFDPTTAEGRFNAAKLNGYLHIMNKNLAEENEALHERLKHVEETSGQGSGSEASLESAIEAGPVDATTSYWHDMVASQEEDKERLEDEANRLKADLDRLKAALAQREQDNRDLQAQLDDANKDTDVWKKRVEDLEKVNERESRRYEEERKDLEQNAERIATDFQERLDRGSQEKNELRVRLKEMEGGGSADVIQELQEKLDTERTHNERATNQLQEETRRLQLRIQELQRTSNEQDNCLDDLRTAKATLSAVQEELQLLTTQLRQTQQLLSDERVLTANKEIEVEKLHATLAVISEQCAEAEGNADAWKEHVEVWKGQVATMAAEVDSAVSIDKHRKIVADLEHELETARRQIGKLVSTEEHQRVVSELREELDIAHRELGKLRHQLSSPSHEAIAGARNARIKILETENADLRQTLELLKQEQVSQTPGKTAMLEGTPTIRKPAATIRMPFTPGAPLRDISWLNNTTRQSEAEIAMAARVQRLEDELRQKEQQVDEKLDLLQDKEQGRLALVDKLSLAKALERDLEAQIERMRTGEKLVEARLEKLKCAKCKRRFDASWVTKLDSEDPELSITRIEESLVLDPSKPFEAQLAAAALYNPKLTSLRADWERQREHFQDERQTLKDANSKLHKERVEEQRKADRNLRTALDNERRKAEVEANKFKGEEAQKRALLLADLQLAQTSLADLRAELTKERDQMQLLKEAEAKAFREKDGLAARLKLKESEIHDILGQLQKAKESKIVCERQIRAYAQEADKGRLAETRYNDAQNTIKTLQQERSSLLSDKADLQRQHAEASDREEAAYQKLAACERSHEKRKRQLEAQAIEMEEMRRMLSRQADKLQTAEAEMDHLHGRDLANQQALSDLQEDVQRNRRDAEKFSKDFLALRSERDAWETKLQDQKAQVERYKAQTQTEIRLLKERLAEAHDRQRSLQERVEQHICAMNSEEKAHLLSLHKQESKGLLVRIKYLKHSVTRESTLRMRLSSQKHYLQALLSSLEASHQTLMQYAVLNGFPPPTKQPRRLGLKSVALCVLFLARARRDSDDWREKQASKASITAAHEDVRRRRISPLP